MLVKNKKLCFFIVLIIFLVCLGGIWAVIIEPNMLKVTSYDIKDEKLKGLRVVYASDFHFRKYQEKRLQKVVNTINQQSPDIILLGGDFVNSHKASRTMPINVIVKGFSALKSKYGVFAVLGNHDWWQDGYKITESLENQDIKVLANENCSVKINGENVYIAGVEDYLTRTSDLNKALKGTKSPVILLSHSPAILPLINNKVNMTLAGHTHGGQISFPFLGALAIPYDCKRNLLYGLHNIKQNKVIISSGIGTSILPARFNSIPEIVVVNFK